MSVYETEEEQVEAIKKWWKENGLSVISGVVLGFVAIGGWQGWQKYEAAQGEAASLRYEQLQAASSAGNTGEALRQGQELLGEYPGSTYAVLAALQMAKLAYQSDEKEMALQQLQWALDNADDPALGSLAGLRLARLLIDLQRADAAATALAAADGAGFAAQKAEIEGDLARLRGDEAGARAAYRRALDAGASDADLVRMKLIDLGGEVSAS